MIFWTKKAFKRYLQGGQKVFAYGLPVIVSGFLSGLFISNYLPGTIIVFLLFFLWSVSLLIINLFFGRVFIFWLSVFLLFLSLALLRTWFFEMNIRDMSLENNLMEQVILSGQVLEQPNCRGLYCQFVFQPDDYSVKILVSTRTENIDFSCGQKIKVKGKLTRPTSLKDESGQEFAYDRYLASRGIYYLISWAGIERELEDNNHYCYYLNQIKESLMQGPKYYLPQPHYSYLAGMLLGERLPARERTKTMELGIGHLFVVSGYHLQIIAGMIFGFLYFLSPAIRLPIISSILLFFITLAGFKASAWRAGFMAILGGGLFVLGRPRNSFYVLLLALLLLSFWNPLSLFYNRGFQLSFLAASGLILFGDFWYRKIDFLPLADMFKRSMAAFLAVYSFIFPWLILFFGGVTLWSFPANIFIAPLAPFIIFFGFLTSLAYTLSSWLAFVPAVIVYLLLIIQITLIDIFYYLIKLENSLQSLLIICFLFLIIIYLLILKRHR